MPWPWAKKKEKTGSSAPDLLLIDHLRDELLLLTSGIPECSDSCAYEAVQQLLAIGCSDGRVKLFGQLGVEKTLESASGRPSRSGRPSGSVRPQQGQAQAPASGTRQLLFLRNRGILLRLSEDGLVEAWDLLDGSGATSRQALRQLLVSDLLPADPAETAAGDRIRCLALLPGEPFLALGCSTGHIRFAALVDGNGCPVKTGRRLAYAARGLQGLPHMVTPEQLGSKGEVSHLQAFNAASVFRLLALHSGGCMAVWDVRSCALLAAVSDTHPAVKRYGPISSACWLAAGCGGSGAWFVATGHPWGDLVVWSLPRLCQELAAMVGGAPPSCTLVTQLRIVLDEAGPVRDVYCLGGAAAGAGGNTAAAAAAAAASAAAALRGRSLLVLGGGAAEMPEGLTRMSLTAAATAAAEAEHEEADGSEGSSAGRAGRLDAGGGEEDLDGEAEEEGEEVQRLPWLGPVRGLATVPAPGFRSEADEAPLAVLQLLSSGTWRCRRDLDGGGQQSVLFAPPLQALAQRQSSTRLTAARLCCLPVARALRRGGGGAPRALSLSVMRAVAVLANPDEAATAAVASHGSDGAAVDDDNVDRQSQLPAAGPAAAAQPPPPAALEASVRVAAVVLGSGTVPEPDPEAAAGLVLATAHADGGLRIWDVYGEQPMLLASVPSGAAAAALAPGSAGTGEGPPAPDSGDGGVDGAGVSTFELVVEDDLLVTGHANGEVRVYQFSKRASHGASWACLVLAPPGQQHAAGSSPPGSPGSPAGTPTGRIESRTASGTLTGYTARLSEPPGFQLRLTAHLHSEVTCLAYCPANKALAIGDKDGGVTALDLSGSPAPLWRCDAGGSTPSSTPLAAVQIAEMGSSTPTATTASAAASAAPAAGVFYATADGFLGVLALRGGGAALCRKPVKAAGGAPLSLQLLDAKGAPTWLSTYPFTQASLSSDITLEGQGTQQQSEGGDKEGPALAPKPAAAHSVLLCCESHVHVYRTSDLLAGSTGGTGEASMQLAEPARHAGTFHVDGAPGVVMVTKTGAMEVYSLPSLTQLSHVTLSKSLGWKLEGSSKPGQLIHHTVASSHLGHLAIVTPSGELALLAIAEGIPEQQWGRGVYDWESAAEAIAAALEGQQAQDARLREYQQSLQHDEGRYGSGSGGGGLEDRSSAGAASVASEHGSGGGGSPTLRAKDSGANIAFLDDEHGGALGGSGAAGKAALSSGGASIGSSGAGIGSRGGSKKFGIGGVIGAVAGGVGSALGDAIGGVAKGVGKGVGSVGSATESLASKVLSAVKDSDVGKGLQAVTKGLHDGVGFGTSSAGGAGTDGGSDRASSITARQQQVPDAMQRYNDTHPPLAEVMQSSAADLRRGRSDWETEGFEYVPKLQIGERVEAGDGEEEGEEEGSSSRESLGAAAAAPRARGGAGAGGARGYVGGVLAYAGATAGKPGGKEKEPSGKKDRDELLGVTSSTPQVRTLSQIKRHYKGEDAAGGSGRVSEVHDLAHENRRKLEERGEKLKHLGDKAGDLEDAAANFADLAKQLKERQGGGKWW